MSHEEMDAEDYNDKDDDSEDDSDDSSDDDENENVSMMDDSFVDRLEVKLMSEPNNYEAHLSYVEACRKTGRLDKLREARENMNKIFPLPEDQWLAWLEDEQRLVSSVQEVESVIALYERAVKDYLSVPIWEGYCKFMVDRFAPSELLPDVPVESIKKVRQVFEVAVSNCGIHMQEAHKIWNPFRTFEQALLDSMKAAKKPQAEIKKQQDAVRSIFKRQLSIPHSAMKEAYDQYKKWETGNADDVEQGYLRALEMFEQRIPYEQQIADSAPNGSPDYTKLENWKSYVEFEKSNNDPSRTLCLLERAVKIYFLSADMWQYYITYLEKGFKSSSAMLIAVHDRATRNCPWTGILWASYLRALERAEKPQATVEQVFEKALVSGMQTAEDFANIFQTYADYQRRSTKMSKDGKIADASAAPIRATFQRAVEYIGSYFPDSPSLGQVQKYWAGLEARIFGNIKNARQLFDPLLKKHGREADVWVQYIAIERYMGEMNNCRSLYKRATQSARDYPERIWEDWQTFEREVGTLEQYELALDKVAQAAKDITAIREKEAAIAQEEFQKQQKDKMKREQRDRRDNKRKMGADRRDTRGERSFDSTKRQKVRDNDTTGKPVSNIVEARVVFVVNLAFDINEEELQKLFSQFGKVSGVRLIREKDGKSKGFAYVEFEAEEAAQKALSMDKTLYRGRNLKVSISNPPKPRKEREPPAPANSLSLYVSNLTPDTEPEDLTQQFSQIGKVIDVRLVRDKVTKKCKGFAYLDLENEEAVQKALQWNAKQELKGQVMYIERSAVGKSKTQTKAPTKEEPKASEPSTAQAEAPKEKANFLVPRSVKKPSAPAGPPKSNAEFRKQLLGK